MSNPLSFSFMRHQRQANDWDVPWRDELEDMQDILNQDEFELKIAKLPNTTDWSRGQNHEGNNTILISIVGTCCIVLLVIIAYCLKK